MMVIGNVKNMTSQLVGQYEKSSGANNADALHAGVGQTVGKSVAPLASPDDKVNFSAKSQDFVQIKNAVAKLPDVRDEVVQSLKAQIEKGAYQIDSSKIAGKMVRESLLDIFA
jgi:flagellar biosynthesis anti-sigma factor FlgM